MRNWIFAFAGFGAAAAMLATFAFGGSPFASSASSRTFRICPGPDAQKEAFVALFEAREGDTLSFCAGRFEFDRGLSLHDRRGITIKGAGKDQTVLSFKSSELPEGLFIARVEGLTLQGLTIEDTPERGVWIKDSTSVTVRDLRVQWSGYASCGAGPAAPACQVKGNMGLVVGNGRHVLIEDSEFFGAAGDGVQIGEGRDVTVRRSRADYNSTGFSFIKTYRGLVEDSVATNNTSGLVAFEETFGARRYGGKIIVRNNRFVGNNSTRSSLTGFGMVLGAEDQVEVHGNEISGNGFTGIVIINGEYVTRTARSRKFDAFPKGIDVHDNVFRDNGGVAPSDPLNASIAARNGGKSAHILWDGAVDQPNDCAAVPTDEDFVPLNKPNPDSAREEGRTDERGRPQFQESDPEPACRWTAWKFDGQGKLKPENGIYIRNNRFENTRPNELRVDDFLNFELRFPADMQTTKVPVFHDLAAHAGSLPPLAEPSLPRFVAKPAEVRPDAAAIAAACSAPPAGEVNWAALARYNCPLLHQYGLFADPRDPRSKPNGFGVPYEINSALFSDYAVKYRVLFLPPGGKAIYGDHAGDPTTTDDDNVMRGLQLPVGTVIAKTFAFRKDDATGKVLSENVVETRLLIKREENGTPLWVGMAYIWKDTGAGRVAELHLEGGHAAVEFDYLDKDPDVKDASGKRRRYVGATGRYSIPEAANCAQCHGGGKREAGAAPISLKPRYLNRNNACPNGAASMNQLQCLESLGLLQGLPADAKAIEKHPRWNVPGDSGLPANSPADVQQRTRAYLEINCAHCHTQGGKTEDYVLFLDSFRPVDEWYGICKPPITAPLMGGRNYDIVPGHADQSVLPHRDMSPESVVRMPQLARSLVNNEARELVSTWINVALPALDAEDDSAVQNEDACAPAGAPTP